MSRVLIADDTKVYGRNKFGKNVTVWHFVLIRENNVIGNNVSIGSYTEIAHHVKIGNNVRIHSKCFIPEHTVIENGAWIGPCVTITNDRHPQTEGKHRKGVKIGKGAVVGANSTIMANVGERATVGAGSVITKPVPKGETWAGNPGRKL